jgi:hypothetical protein
MRLFPQHRLLAAAIFSLLGAVPLCAQGVFVTDFHSLTAGFFDLSATAHLRRGTTSNVQIVKDLIDLVPFDQVKTSTSGVTISGISNGRTSAGKGFIQFSVTVPATQSLGSTVTIDIGLLDHYKFLVLRKGLIAATPTMTPDPSTVAAGTAVAITVTGTDFGTPSLTGMTCHTIVPGATSSTSFTASVTRNANCTNNGPFGFVVNGTGSSDVQPYATSTHVTSFAFPAYKTLPPPPPPCVSAPGIGAPVVTSPTNGQRFEFVQGTTSPQSLTMRWNSITNTNQAAPNNEFIVVLTKTDGIIRTTTRDLSNTVTSKDSLLVTALAITRNFVLPGAYQLSIRARNCGDFGPITNVAFQLTFRQ